MFWAAAIPAQADEVQADQVQTVAQPSELDEFVFFAEYQPPYVFVEQGQNKGIASDLLAEVLARVGSTKAQKDFVMVPWVRGYTEVQTRPKAMLFSMYLTEERRPLFKWVGPIITSRVVTVAKRERAIRILQRADVGQYRTGLTRNGIAYLLLQAAGVKDESFTQLSDSYKGAQLLKRDRIDLWAADENLVLWTFHNAGQDVAAYEVVHTLLENGLYYAFNLETDDSLIAGMQASLDEMQRDGTTSKIIQTYLPDSVGFSR